MIEKDGNPAEDYIKIACEKALRENQHKFDKQIVFWNSVKIDVEFTEDDFKKP